MGNISSCTLQQEELARLSAKSVFTQDEVKALWLQFSGITASEGGISREKFQSAMMFKETAMQYLDLAAGSDGPAVLNIVP